MSVIEIIKKKLLHLLTGACKLFTDHLDEVWNCNYSGNLELPLASEHGYVKKKDTYRWKKEKWRRMETYNVIDSVMLFVRSNG